MRESQILRRLAFLLNQILQAELFGEFSSWLMSLLKPCFRCPCCTCVRIICPHFTQTFARFGTDPTDEDSQNGVIEEDFRSPLNCLPTAQQMVIYGALNTVTPTPWTPTRGHG